MNPDMPLLPVPSFPYSECLFNDSLCSAACNAIDVAKLVQGSILQPKLRATSHMRDHIAVAAVRLKPTQGGYPTLFVVVPHLMADERGLARAADHTAMSRCIESVFADSLPRLATT